MPRKFIQISQLGNFWFLLLILNLVIDFSIRIDFVQPLPDYFAVCLLL